MLVDQAERLRFGSFARVMAYWCLRGDDLGAGQRHRGQSRQPGPYLDAAWVERVGFDGPSRVIDVGVRQRLFGGATRRAVQVRDRRCLHDTCDIGAEDCEVDLVVAWAEGGPPRGPPPRPTDGSPAGSTTGPASEDPDPRLS